MEALVVPLTQLDRSSIAVAGGKAANLGALLQAGFAVPPGVSITTAAYRRVVANAGIAPRIAEILQGLDVEDSAALAAAGAGVRELFYHAPIPEDVQEAIASAARMVDTEEATREKTLRRAGDALTRRQDASTSGQKTGKLSTSHCALAVRSSATAEDLPEASFAGQQETYLNVIGEESLLEAVRRCWASLWTDRAIAYRQRNGIPNARVALAVVVQRMVPAAVAGVLFTANPVSGKRSEMIVEASLGLGEAVVSGVVSPDTYVVDKGPTRIVHKEIGAKSVQVVGSPEGGTATVPVDDATRLRQALSDDAIITLAQLGKRIEGLFGSPQDVEWAYADGKLYVLQSRPITTLFPAPPPTPPDQLRIYISLNSAQGMLGPFTPMGASLFSEMARGAWFRNDAQDSPLLELGGRIFVEATGLLRSEIGRRLISSALPQAEPVMARILEKLMQDPRLQPTPASRKWTPWQLFLRYRRTVVPILLRVARFVAFPAQARQYGERVVAPKLAEAREEMDRRLQLGREGSFVRQLSQRELRDRIAPRLVPLVATGMLCYKIAETIVRRNGLDQRLLTTARSGLPYNRTTTMDLALWSLTEKIRLDDASLRALTDQSPGDLARSYLRHALPTALQTGMEAFLSRYGHRAVREIDIGMPRWSEDPTYLFGVLQGYLAIPPDDEAPDRHFARQVTGGERAVSDLIAEARHAPGGWWKAKVLAFVLWRYRQLGGLRETPKFYVMWLFQGIRDMLLTSGRRLVEMDLLDRPKDVFFLRLPELARLDEEGARWRRLVVERRAVYQHELQRHRAPRVMTSEGESFYGEALAPAEGQLAGTGVSPGVARGRARVIRNPAGARLEPGEILVAPSTDPAWTPLFFSAGGLVMEAGGMMSHGAIVAREYGIPAVVGGGRGHGPHSQRPGARGRREHGARDSRRWHTFCAHSQMKTRAASSLGGFLWTAESMRFPLRGCELA